MNKNNKKGGKNQQDCNPRWLAGCLVGDKINEQCRKTYKLSLGDSVIYKAIGNEVEFADGCNGDAKPHGMDQFKKVCPCFVCVYCVYT